MQGRESALNIVAATANPHFERIGGQVVVDAIVDSFYGYMDGLPEAGGIRAMHEPDLSGARATLKLFLTEWLGGPKVFSQSRGHPRLRQRHAAFPIGPAERDAWLLCMSRALEDFVPDVGLREQLTQAFFKTADFIRNDPRGLT